MSQGCLVLRWQGDTFQRCNNPIIGGAELEYHDGHTSWVYWCQHHEYESERRITELVNMALLVGFMSAYIEWLPSLN